MMEAFRNGISESFLPQFFMKIDDAYHGNLTAFAEATYRKTIIKHKEQVLKILDIYQRKPEEAIAKLNNDPGAVYFDQIREQYIIGIHPVYDMLQHELEKVNKSYMSAQLEMASDQPLYPDANFTMRLTYGKIDGYQPMDGVHYQYCTTLSGLMEKGGEEIDDYRVPEKLSQLYQEKDFGRYGVDGKMPVCFIASNHTSGGNSGSPVLDADGCLVGINFDRNWEGTMSDVYYDPSICRNIAVDIRYVLFIVDKFAGAGYLLDEMKIKW